ncbi:MAG: DUF1800 family protein [Paracoccaceae bacterium]
MEPASLLEEIRFGYGPLAGTTPAPGGVNPDRVLAQLTATDLSASVWNRPGIADRYALFAQFKQEKMAAHPKKGGTNNKVNAIAPENMAAPENMSETEGMIVKGGAGKQLKDLEKVDEETFVSRPATASLGFVERLVNLWANRITISDSGGGVGRYIQNFRDEAIRPHIAGRYADLLKATLWHPGMLTYLTQYGSTGPNSKLGLRKGIGLNENLAREFLELHSMNTGYTQGDVTQLATLLAGMTTDATGSRVDDRRSEPGLKHILGQAYGDRDPMGEIDRLIEAVAHRPETAQATAFYIARHFIADTPPADLVTALAASYTANDTNLIPVYRTLLEHPSAQSADRQKLRSPQEFAAASLRLMGLTGQEDKMLGFNKHSMQVPAALARMGQPVFKALRPDGWPETSPGWMTPPMIAARIDWAVDVARATGDRADPVALTDFALGSYATPLLRRAVGGAEQRWEGLAVLLASPDFSRR